MVGQSSWWSSSMLKLMSASSEGQTNNNKTDIMLKKLFNKIFDIHPKAISFRESMDLTGLPMVTFYQGDRKYNFLFDTGSNDNIIDASVLDEVDYEKVDYEGTLSGLDGKVHKVDKCNITFSYKDEVYPFDYLIKDMRAPFDLMKNDYGVNLHGVIGSRFFNKFKYVLDFDALIAYTKM